MIRIPFAATCAAAILGVPITSYSAEHFLLGSTCVAVGVAILMRLSEGPRRDRR